MTVQTPNRPTQSRDLYPIARLIAALALMSIGGSAMYATIVVLKPIAAEFETSRGTASMPYMLFMIGFGLGSVTIGRVADRYGILVPALCASIMLPVGLVLAAFAQNIWQFCLSIGLLTGFFGAAPTFAPLVADISHWFDRRRGLALGIVISGTYVAGAVWPPILQFFIDGHGWRQTLIWLAAFAICTMTPLAAAFYRKPVPPQDADDLAAARKRQRPLNLPANGLQCLICFAGVGCCAAMAMPQVHIVPYATDLGFAPQRGAEMLSLMLGFGVVSRLVSGWLSDRVGGLGTLLVGSLLQALVLIAFLFADTLTALYLVSIAFGLSQGGIVPSYAMIIRRFFAAGDAGWRIGLSLLFTMIGMALGGWMAGALFDLTGSYTASFLNAIAFNILNLAIAIWMLERAWFIARNDQLPVQAQG